MKLAEALMQRADAQKRVQQLRERFARVAIIQEGETPPENPQELMNELTQTLNTLANLIKRINRTNSTTLFATGLTLTDALADRDMLALERSVVEGLIQAASPQNFRYGRSEIKYVMTVNVSELQKRMDGLARDYRELDARIQEMNWLVDLVE